MRVHRDVKAIGEKLAGDREALELIALVVEAIVKRAKTRRRAPSRSRRSSRR